MYLRAYLIPVLHIITSKRKQYDQNDMIERHYVFSSHYCRIIPINRTVCMPTRLSHQSANLRQKPVRKQAPRAIRRRLFVQPSLEAHQESHPVVIYWVIGSQDSRDVFGCVSHRWFHPFIHRIDLSHIECQREDCSLSVLQRPLFCVLGTKMYPYTQCNIWKCLNSNTDKIKWSKIFEYESIFIHLARYVSYLLWILWVYSTICVAIAQ